VLTRIKRSYDLSSKIEAFTRVQASSSRGFFIHKILMGVDYLSTDLDGYTLLPEVTPVVDPTGSPTGVGIVRCARYRFYDDGFYMNFRDNVSFLEDPNRWKCFTSATIDPSRFLAWTQVRGSYLKVEFPHVISLSSVPFYCRKRRVSTRSLFGSPRRALEFLNAVLRVFIRRELSCYVGFPSAEIMSMYKRDFDVLPVVKIFADENKPVDDIRQAPIVSKPCAIYFDYCRSRTVRGLDFFNYDVALLVSLPVQNLADWQWEASQLLRIAKRFRDDGLVVSAGNEVLRRAVNEAAQFFSRIYTPEIYRGKVFVSLDRRVVEYAHLAPAWVRELLSNVVLFDSPSVFLPSSGSSRSVDIVEYLKPESPRSAAEQLSAGLGMSVEEVRSLLDAAVREGRAVREGNVYFRA